MLPARDLSAAARTSTVLAGSRRPSPTSSRWPPPPPAPDRPQPPGRGGPAPAAAEGGEVVLPDQGGGGLAHPLQVEPPRPGEHEAAEQRVGVGGVVHAGHIGAQAARR